MAPKPNRKRGCHGPDHGGPQASSEVRQQREPWTYCPCPRRPAHQPPKQGPGLRCVKTKQASKQTCCLQREHFLPQREGRSAKVGSIRSRELFSVTPGATETVRGWGRGLRTRDPGLSPAPPGPGGPRAWVLPAECCWVCPWGPEHLTPPQDSTRGTVLMPYLETGVQGL